MLRTENQLLSEAVEALREAQHGKDVDIEKLMQYFRENPTHSIKRSASELGLSPIKVANVLHYNKEAMREIEKIRGKRFNAWSQTVFTDKELEQFFIDNPGSKASDAARHFKMAPAAIVRRIRRSPQLTGSQAIKIRTIRTFTDDELIQYIKDNPLMPLADVAKHFGHGESYISAVLGLNPELKRRALQAIGRSKFYNRVKKQIVRRASSVIASQIEDKVMSFFKSNPTASINDAAIALKVEPSKVEKAIISARDRLSALLREAVAALRESQKEIKYRDIEGTVPGRKDMMRMQNIKDRAKGDEDKVLRQARAMAWKITTPEKAERRARAAIEVFGGEFGDRLARIFRRSTGDPKERAKLRGRSRDKQYVDEDKVGEN